MFNYLSNDVILKLNCFLNRFIVSHCYEFVIGSSWYKYNFKAEFIFNYCFILIIILILYICFIFWLLSVQIYFLECAIGYPHITIFIQCAKIWIILTKDIIIIINSFYLFIYMEKKELYKSDRFNFTNLTVLLINSFFLRWIYRSLAFIRALHFYFDFTLKNKNVFL